MVGEAEDNFSPVVDEAVVADGGTERMLKQVTTAIARSLGDRES
jgi:hypothetical protein